VRPSILLIIGLSLTMAPPVGAGTFVRAPIAPTLGLDALTRAVARERLGRDVFSNPYATVTISHVDIYDRVPYVEARRFQIVSDPAWNRMICGEEGQDLEAYDGQGSALGRLSGPHGMAVDDQDRLYVADTGNDRIVVLQVSTEFGAVTLVPLYAIGGLHGPYDVAISDGGTPFVPGDDVLYVADTGMNRVVAFAPGTDGARPIATLGSLGSGPGQFAGPLAIAAGRSNGVSTNDLYVADAHSRRIVHLRLEGGALRWVGAAPVGADVVTSLDTDRWGNLYAAAPQQGVVRKFNADLEPVADLAGLLARPRGVHLAFSTIRDHRDGSVRRVGEPDAVTLDQWADASGVMLWNLGVAIDGLRVTSDGPPAAHFSLSDQATVTFEVADGSDGRTLARRTIGSLGAGAHDVAFQPEDLAAAGGTDHPVLRLVAASGYADGASDVAHTAFSVSGGVPGPLPTRALLIGNSPNPARPSTRITFVLPSTRGERVSLDLFDAAGRRVRHFERGFTPGLNEVDWDGTDERGQNVRAGLFFYRLDVGRQSFTRRMALVR
jgi:hypothetical protein